MIFQGIFSLGRMAFFFFSSTEEERGKKYEEGTGEKTSIYPQVTTDENKCQNTLLHLSLD